ncbi:DNA translocase FtsK [Bartonella sp. HY329]|uniref:FtsK/SpoIIIE family DNA translocase n=1 Tax=unclassified Bartonella TaxID=2645622 RepID=UPI0021C84289|nr:MULTISPECIES: DNA translocase FtsK [unclassified Bartonella]UXM95602.1 DNA translocase FtsK [Bartonella sp. HY329]UXN09927.1 DNA translocase FtsK [Bartonella sp. HY328]
MKQGHSTYNLPEESDYQAPRFSHVLYRQLGTFLGLGLLILVVLAAIALATWNFADPSLSFANNNPVTNQLGFWGAAYADIALQFFGLAAPVNLLPPFFWAILLLMQRDIPKPITRIVLWGFSGIFFATAIATIPPIAGWPMPMGLGGVVGDKFLGFFDQLLSFIPKAIRDIVIAVVFAPLALITVAYAGAMIGRNKAKKRQKLVETKRSNRAEDYEDAPRAGIFVTMFGLTMHLFMRVQAFFSRIKAKRAEKIAEQEQIKPSNKQAEARPARQTTTSSERVEPNFNQDIDDIDESNENNTPTNTSASLAAEAPTRSPRAASRTQNTKSQSIIAKKINNNGFELPHLEFLAEPKETFKDTSLSKEQLAQNAERLGGVLEDFGIKGTIIDVRPGPVVTLYEVEPAPGVKSSRIISLADDIARSMSAVSARIAVVAGRNAIGIELPNKHRETVYLREIFETRDYRDSKAKLGLALGKTINGNAVIADLAKMPHVLVAGTTGSGKSVAINTMIMSLLFKHTPQECRLIMVDPKMLELSVYDGIPHLLTPVVTDPKKAVVALKWAVREMEERYRNMSKLGVRNIDGFNERLQKAQENGESLSRTVQTGFDNETGKPIFETEHFDMKIMPYIVVIIDEMADLMMVAGKEIEGAVQRLAQMARAAGIHVIMATQRPSVDVITGTIKANFPTRISFSVTSKIDSRTILGEQGAEQLLGQGDMLFMMGGGRTQRVHGPFIGDHEVETIVNHLKTQGTPEYLDAVMEDQGDDESDSASNNSGMASSDDPYDQAVAIVLRDKKASTSYIQRRLGIGYNRAASIIERMEEEGIISPANHAGKREILIEDGNDSY